MCTTSSSNSVVCCRKHTRKSKIIIQEDCPDTNFCPEVPHITLQCKISGPQTQPLNLTKKAPSPANTHSSFHSMLLPYPNPVTMSKSQAVEPHLNDISTRMLANLKVTPPLLAAPQPGVKSCQENQNPCFRSQLWTGNSTLKSGFSQPEALQSLSVTKL